MSASPRVLCARWFVPPPPPPPPPPPLPPPPPPLGAQDLGEQVFPVHKLAQAGSVQGWYNCKQPGTAAKKDAPDALGVRYSLARSPSVRPARPTALHPSFPPALSISLARLPVPPSLPLSFSPSPAAALWIFSLACAICSYARHYDAIRLILHVLPPGWNPVTNANDGDPLSIKCKVAVQ